MVEPIRGTFAIDINPNADGVCGSFEFSIATKFVILFGLLQVESFMVSHDQHCDRNGRRLFVCPLSSR